MFAPKAVYIAFEAFPRPKGASTHIAAMVECLARCEGPVLLLCCGYGEMPAVQQEGAITIRRHKMYHPNMLRRAVDFAAFVRRTLESLPAPPAICVFRDPWSGVPAIESGLDAAMVFEVNGLPGWELPYLYPAVARNAALRAKIDDLEHFCLARADALITVSGVTRDALRTRGVACERIAVVPNTAGECFFAAGDGLTLPIPELAQGRWFGYVGSLHPWQGVDVLLAAWARIAANWPDVRLLIVHNNSRARLKPLRKLARRLGLESRVLWHAPLEPEALAAVLRRLEFTCAPLRETFRNTVQGCCPVKIIESMAAGVPVVASDLRAVRELVAAPRGFPLPFDGRGAGGEGLPDGLLVCPDEPRAWAVALDGLLGDCARRDCLAAAAAAKARACFTNTMIYAKLAQAFAAAQRVRVGTKQVPSPSGRGLG